MPLPAQPLCPTADSPRWACSLASLGRRQHPALACCAALRLLLTTRSLAPPIPRPPGMASLEEEAWGNARHQGSAAGAPAAMHSLLSALQRARHLLCKGARELAGEAQVGKAVQVCCRHGQAGRSGGPLNDCSSKTGPSSGLTACVPHC